jgi:hypothetical protein
MRVKHYPDKKQLKELHKKIIASVTALLHESIAIKSIDCTQGEIPIIEVYNCPRNRKLYGVACGTGADHYGEFVRKDARVMGCRVTWVEEKR